LSLLASLGVTSPSGAKGPALSDATPAQRKSAEKKLSEGQKLLKAGKVDQALAAFDASYDLVADPQARLLAARVYQNQGELLKAHAAYVEAVAEAEIAVRTREQSRQTLQEAKKELKDLEGVLARLTIRLRHAPEGTRVTIDGEPVAADKLGEPILLPPGQVKVVAQTQDGREASRSPTLTAGQDAKIELAFAREDSPDAAPIADGDSDASEPATEQAAAVKVEPTTAGNGKRTAAFIAGGVGVAGLATFGVLGAMSNSKYNDLEDACPNGRCSSDQQGKIDDGKLYQTLANVGLVVGVVGVGASVTLFVLSSSGPAEKAARLELRAGLRSVELRGRFE
jgi:tetratricopeptide (TPR) repeat protein